MKTRNPVLIGSVLIGVFLFSACAVSDVPSLPGPPITLSPPPTLVVSTDISCDDTPKLEAWLQASTFMKEDFLELVESVEGRRRDRVYNDVLELAIKRDSASTIPVPDCAEEAHQIIIDAMNKAVDALVEYNNGDRENVKSVVSTLKSKFDEAGVLQLELTDRLEAQYKNQ